jgi:putative ABC transport system permease protein
VRQQQLKSLIWKASAQDEVDAELAFHVEMRTRELIASGVHPDTARRQAIARFGDLGHVSDTCKTIADQRDRDMRRIEYFSELTQDVRFSLRQLAQNRAFTFVAVLTLALGIGATTAIFSAVRAVVLRPFGYAEPERVMIVGESWGANPMANVSAGNYVDWQAQSRSFEHLAAIQYASVNLNDGDTPERVFGALATWNFFAAFGARPALGRTFAAEEDQPGRDRVVVLSHELWQRKFAGDSAVLGREMRINGDPFVVIGVMRPGFDPALAQEQLWVPVAFSPERRAMHDEHYLNVYGLLARGVTAESAQGEMDRIAAAQRQRFPRENDGRGITVTSLQTFVVGNYRQRLFVLLGAVSLVLLIACGNVANLLLARGAAREKEIAIRTAIGAGRGRIVRQLLTESLVLSLAGAAVGLALAWGLVSVLVAAAPGGIPRLAETRIDLWVLLFALAASVVSSVVFGLVPAVRAGRVDLQPILKEGGRSFAAGARDHVRAALVVAEVALSLTLLVGAGLLIRSAMYLQRVDPGFDVQGLLTARVGLPPRAYKQGADETLRTFEQLIESVRQQPGVRAASLTSQAPMGPGGNSNGLLPEGKAEKQENYIDSRLRMVTPGYFATMGIRLVKGRDLTPEDVRSSPLVMVVSEALAKRAFPNEDVIGKRISCCESGAGGEGTPSWKTVVGVVADVRSSGPTQDPRPEFYLPIRQVPPQAWNWTRNALTVVVRAQTEDAASLTPAIRSAVRGVDRTVPVYSISTMTEALRATIAPARFNTMLLASLGAIGLLLAAVGIYSVIAYFVSLRTHEIGIRMALGATTRDVLGLLTWQGVRPVFIGVAIGAVGAFWATRLLQGSLYGVSPNDPLTFGLVALVMILVSVLAAVIPAQRATKVDPTRALAG